MLTDYRRLRQSKEKLSLPIGTTELKSQKWSRFEHCSEYMYFQMVPNTCGHIKPYFGPFPPKKGQKLWAAKSFPTLSEFFLKSVWRIDLQTHFKGVLGWGAFFGPLELPTGPTSEVTGPVFELSWHLTLTLLPVKYQIICMNIYMAGNKISMAAAAASHQNHMQYPFPRGKIKK